MNPLGVPIGWAGGTDLNSIAEVRTEARYAVEAGFDSFWVSQIFGVDPIVALAAISADVKSLSEVGTSVVPLYGRHPLALAAQALTAQNKDASEVQERFDTVWSQADVTLSASRL